MLYLAWAAGIAGAIMVCCAVAYLVEKWEQF